MWVIVLHLKTLFYLERRKGIATVLRNQKDIENVIRTIEKYQQHGKVVNERSTRSPNVSQKSGPQKHRTQLTTQEQNKYSMDNYNDGGDNNPPKGSLERPHKILVTSKIKR
jgi:hypothetical protein